ncbi:MAG: amidohydrolase family protein, partial [Clostridia bacterium]|nr:amidohydrolase family protein [Clostridia bacterium]
MKTLIHNVELITMDKENNQYADGIILYNDDTIEYAGPASGFDQNESKNSMDKPQLIDGKGMTALPGFVNAHTHTAMTAFRGYADGQPLWEWLSETIWPMEERLEPGDTYWLTLLGAAEMISAGVTTFLDMYMFMTDTARAVSECGMRAVLSRALMGPDKSTGQRYREVDELSHWRYKADGRIN